MLAKFAAVAHFADHFVAMDGDDAQLDEPIGQQNASAAMHFLRQRSKGSGDAFRAARIVAGSNLESLPGAQHDGSAAQQRAGANFRPAQICKNSDGFFRADCRLTNALDGAQVPVMRTMRKIQAHHVHPRADELFDAPLRIGRGAQSANDF